MIRDNPLTGPSLFLRSRGAIWLLAICAAVAAVGRLTPIGLVSVPFREHDLAVISTVVVALPAAFVHLCLRRPSAQLERQSSRILTIRCLWWLAVTISVTTTALVAAAHRDPGSGLVLARNTVTLIGLTTLTARVTQPGLAWLVALAYAGLCLTYGTTGPTGEPQSWALLMHPSNALVPWVFGAIVGAMGWAGYSLRDAASPSP